MKKHEDGDLIMPLEVRDPKKTNAKSNGIATTVITRIARKRSTASGAALPGG